MKFKKEYVILFVLIVALVAYLWLRPGDRTRYTLPIVPEVDQQAITKIELEVGDTALLLEKKDARWYLPQGYRIAPRKVTAMLDALNDLALTALVSESQDYVRYDLNPENRITVKAWAGGELVRDVVVGKVADSLRHTYVRLAGDDRVYQARQNLRNPFDQSVDSLRDKTVLSFSAGDIQQVTITTAEREMTFARQKAPLQDSAPAAENAQSPESGLKAKMVWRTPEGELGDESSINQLIATLSQLECDSYIDDRPQSDFSDPICRIRLTGTGARSHSLSIFAKQQADAGEHPAVSSESKQAFFLPEWRVKDLTPDLETLLASSEAKKDTSSTP